MTTSLSPETRQAQWLARGIAYENALAGIDEAFRRDGDAEKAITAAMDDIKPLVDDGYEVADVEVAVRMTDAARELAASKVTFLVRKGLGAPTLPSKPAKLTAVPAPAPAEPAPASGAPAPIEKKARVKKARANLNQVGGFDLLDERPESERLIELLNSWGYHFSMNWCSDEVLVNGKPLTDLVEAEIRTQLRDNGMWGMISTAMDAYRVDAARHGFHPVKDFLNTLTWDGADHIQQLAACFHHTMPVIEYSDGNPGDAAQVYLTRFLVGAVGKALDGDQNMMLVLSGPHGIGKSEFAKWLCSPLPEYFNEEGVNPDDRDCTRRLMSTWLWEVGELDATTRKADVAALKAFLTRREVRTRHPYDRRDTVKPALASFIGTVNPSHGGFLAEPDDRRFLVLNLEYIDWGYRAIDVQQLWAQAATLYRRGELGRLETSERHYQVEQNEQHRLPSLLAAQIEQYFSITHDPEHFLRTVDVVAHLASKGARLSNSDKAASMEIASAMQALRIKQARQFGSRGPRGYFGIMPRAAE